MLKIIKAKFKSILNLLDFNKKVRDKFDKQLLELEWANIYHDSIRGKEWLTGLPLNIGRWAGNYTFFYVLNRILMDYKPKRILELGLGESTKFISAYIDHYLLDSNHTVVEQDKEWMKIFLEKNKLSSRSSLICCPLVKVSFQGSEVNTYEGFENKVQDKFDFYLIDGPFGSPRNSRRDILNLLTKLNTDDQFIVLMDDTNRIGEQDTLQEIISILKRNNIPLYIGEYEGVKKLTIIATEKYRFSTSF